ncbi:MAG: excinuclease ABC subunit UvrC [Kiritimatiellia bacterium]
MTDALREKLRILPDKPGCYLFRGRTGRIIYVGKAVSLRKRVQSYFRAATMRHAPPKLRSLVNSVVDLDFLVVRSEEEALLTEGSLIKQHRPRYNILMRDDKRFLSIRADPRDPVPRFTTSRLVRDDGARYFGPFPSDTVVRVAIDFAERRYGLRKCLPLIPDAETHAHCINDIVRFCSAPCIGRISPEAYRERFAEACAFLAGERVQVLEEVAEQMRAAAATRNFEKAAKWRDTLLTLREVVRRRGRVVATPELRADDARRGLEHLRDLLGLTAPPRVIEAFDISNILGSLAVASLVCAVEGVPDRRRYRRFRIRTVVGADDPAMMVEVIGRRYRRAENDHTPAPMPENGGSGGPALPRHVDGQVGRGRCTRRDEHQTGERQPLPDLVLVDGGLTQVRAARRALEALGLSHVPVAGLAKEQEAIVRDNGQPPVLLPRNSPALQVLQRLRDEAHRFALDHHRRLRNRLIRESALDEIPGIGPQRKQTLLQTFGSVYRLARAPLANIAAVPGIGPELAAAILRAVGGADRHCQTRAMLPE